MGCLADDCGSCKFCLDKPKFGGPGKKKKFCIQKKCSKLDVKIATSRKPLSDVSNFNGQGTYNTTLYMYMYMYCTYLYLDRSS